MLGDHLRHFKYIAAGGATVAVAGGLLLAASYLAKPAHMAPMSLHAQVAQTDPAGGTTGTAAPPDTGTATGNPIQQSELAVQQQDQTETQTPSANAPTPPQ